MKVKTILVGLLLLSSLPAAAAECTSARTVEQVAPGLVHLVLCRGEPRDTRGYRVAIGSFARQSEAVQVLDRVRSMGVPALPTSEGAGYRIVTPAFDERGEAEQIAARLLAEGLPGSFPVEEVGQELTNPEGPWRIHLLEVDPKRVEVRVAHAFDAAIGLETTTELARRRGAVAAVNGGYYRMEGLLAGDSQGVLEIEDTLLSEPDRGRAAVGFFEREGATGAVFGRLSFQGAIQLENGELFPLDGLNRPRGDEELLLYSPEFHRTTLTGPEGAELVVEDGRLVEIRKQAGSSQIPSAGFVLSAGPDRVDELLPHLEVGQAISINTELHPLLPDTGGEWQAASHIVGGGPLLLWQGERVEEPGEESISGVFFHARHPRTAVGKRADKTLLFLTVDGRQPRESVGMSLPELTDLLLEFGATFAVNLDGGGSTTMTVRGRTVNVPSSRGRDRRNADAILLFPRAN